MAALWHLMLNLNLHMAGCSSSSLSSGIFPFLVILELVASNSLMKSNGDMRGALYRYFVPAIERIRCGAWWKNCLTFTTFFLPFHYIYMFKLTISMSLSEGAVLHPSTWVTVKHMWAKDVKMSTVVTETFMALDQGVDWWQTKSLVLLKLANCLLTLHGCYFLCYFYCSPDCLLLGLGLGVNRNRKRCSRNDNSTSSTPAGRRLLLH